MAGWQIEKKISVENLLAFVVAFATCIGAYYTVTARIERLEEFKRLQAARDAAQDVQQQEVKREVVQRLDRIEDKLDRAIERQAK